METKSKYIVKLKAATYVPDCWEIKEYFIEALNIKEAEKMALEEVGKPSDILVVYNCDSFYGNRIVFS